jgi:uncharacterized spore protein YtfJ
MDVQEALGKMQDTVTVKRVYGEPYEKNGVTIIPTADVSGGGGAGGGKGSDDSEGGGGGFGVSARPAGVWVVKGDDVEWKPSIDVTKIVLRGQVVGIFFLLAIRAFAKRRRRRK